jgi:hypothetical protein
MFMPYISRAIILVWFVLSSFSTFAQTTGNKLKQPFYDAQMELQAMLEGKTTMNFAKAVFLTENALYGDSLNFEMFEAKIRASAEVVKGISQSNPIYYKGKDSLQAKYQANLFKFLTDTVTVRWEGVDSLGRRGVWEGDILPPRYTWESSSKKHDWKKSSVHHLLKTGESNCHSLPYFYKLIAHELNVPAWLSCAPHHLYIQGYNQESGLFNVELSSGVFPKDSWLMASGYISKEAIQQKAYMDTLTLKESIALCLVDLAKSYQSKFQDADFALACLRTAQKVYPHGLQAYLSEIHIQTILFQQNKRLDTYNRLESLAKKVCGLGYVEIPQKEYSSWNAPHQNNGKKTPFETTLFQSFDVNTLSDGAHQEYHDLAKPRRIGNILYSTKTGKIVEFLKSDLDHWEVDRIARFLSVDPLTKFYPMLTPYQFASNTPIMSVDLDGLESKRSMTSEEQKMFDDKILKPLQAYYDEQKQRLEGALLGAEVSRRAEDLYQENCDWIEPIELRLDAKFSRKEYLFENTFGGCFENVDNKPKEGMASDASSGSFSPAKETMLKVELPDAERVQVAISVSYKKISGTPEEIEKRCISNAETAYIYDTQGEKLDLEWRMNTDNAMYNDKPSSLLLYKFRPFSVVDRERFKNGAPGEKPHMLISTGGSLSGYEKIKMEKFCVHFKIFNPRFIPNKNVWESDVDLEYVPAPTQDEEKPEKKD